MQNKIVLTESEREVVDKIKKLRYDLRLSQEDFSRLIGVRLNSVSRWECYKTYPSRLALQGVERLRKSESERKSKNA